MFHSPFLTGFYVGLSLIVAIGAQNAFVLRQGLRGEHVWLVALTCAMSDAILIFVGVGGFGILLEVAPWIDAVTRYGGALFLAWYGLTNMVSALRSSDALVVADRGGETAARTLATCLALTWLNPHVYLDTVVLIGAVSTRFPGSEFMFASGAATASLLFFLGLAHGASYLRPLFSRPASWRLLEALIAIVMWTIAGRLVLGV